MEATTCDLQSKWEDRKLALHRNTRMGGVSWLSMRLVADLVNTEISIYFQKQNFLSPSRSISFSIRSLLNGVKKVTSSYAMHQTANFALDFRVPQQLLQSK